MEMFILVVIGIFIIIILLSGLIGALYVAYSMYRDYDEKDL